MSRLLICVAGKNNIAVNVLSHLIKNTNDVYDLCVVCNKTDGGVNTFQRSLKLFAAQHSIKECCLEDLYDVENLIFLSLEFDRIIKPELFKTGRLFNIHFSLLPKYKGMYTSALPILFGDEKTGVTLHRIDNGIDTGEIIDQQEFKIEKRDTCRDLYHKYIRYGTDLVIRNINNIIFDNIISCKQSYLKSTYYSKSTINYSNLKIDLNRTAEEVQKQIRAYSFREYQLPEVHGNRIVSSAITNVRSNKKPGTVLLESNRELMIATVDYNIILYIDCLEEILQDCRSGNVNKIRDYYVQKQVNEKDMHGWTPLIVATYSNQIEIVKQLILYGADIHVKNNNGTNLLMYAKSAYVNTGDSTLFRFFYDLGINEYEKDYSERDLHDYLEIEKIDMYDLLRENKRQGKLKKLDR